MNREEKDSKCSQTERYYVHSHFLSVSKGGMLSIGFRGKNREKQEGDGV